MNSYQVSVAAEAIVASLFAQAGYDVLVQYGANQPGYDIVAIKGNRMLRVSVKGSQDEGWNLTGTLKAGRSYHEAADEWLRKHGQDLVFAFVQFAGRPLGTTPGVWIARATSVAQHLKAQGQGRGDTIVWERHTWTRGVCRGHTDEIPATWVFTQERVDSI